MQYSWTIFSLLKSYLFSRTLAQLLHCWHDIFTAAAAATVTLLWLCQYTAGATHPLPPLEPSLLPRHLYSATIITATRSLPLLLATRANMLPPLSRSWCTETTKLLSTLLVLTTVESLLVLLPPYLQAHHHYHIFTPKIITTNIPSSHATFKTNIILISEPQSLQFLFIILNQHAALSPTLHTANSGAMFTIHISNVFAWD